MTGTCISFPHKLLVDREMRTTASAAAAKRKSIFPTCIWKARRLRSSCELLKQKWRGHVILQLQYFFVLSREIGRKGKKQKKDGGYIGQA